MATRTSSVSSSSEGTRAPSIHDGLHQTHDHTKKLNSALPSPIARVATRHEDLDFFDNTGDLQRHLSRTASRFSLKTQDPAGEDFDYKTHLQYVLRKSDANGVLRRNLGVTFEDLHVTGDGSGLAYGPTVGSIFTGVLRIGSAIKASRHPKRKDILQGFTGSLQPKEMLLVLGRFVPPPCLLGVIRACHYAELTNVRYLPPQTWQWMYESLEGHFQQHGSFQSGRREGFLRWYIT